MSGNLELAFGKGRIVGLRKARLGRVRPRDGLQHSAELSSACWDLDILEKRGAKVAYHDPHIPVIRPTREHGHWTGTKSVTWDQQTIASYDAVLISTAHKGVDYQQLADWSNCIIDTRNAMASVKVRPNTIWKA